MRRALSAMAALVVFGVLTGSAQASFHLVKISEVFPGTPAALDKAFIELRMFAPGQNFVGGHSVSVYDDTGAEALTVTMPDDLPNGQNNRTILLGDIDVGNRDFDANLGATMAAGGGAVCFTGAQPVDCVAWGNFAGSLPGDAGTPAAPGGIPGAGTEASSLTRDVSRGCPTFLEALDDTDDSLADFTATENETPESNSDPLSMIACGAAPTPQTTITKKPRRKTAKRTARFRFRSNENGSSFECKLDKRKYKRCTSPRTYKRLKPGKHRFRVRAIGPDGDRDPTPATHRWRVAR